MSKFEQPSKYKTISLIDVPEPVESYSDSRAVNKVALTFRTREEKDIFMLSLKRYHLEKR